MADIITDSYSFEVRIIQHGDVVIENLVSPTEVESGANFNISYDAKNTGSEDTCFGRVMDTDTNSEIVDSYWSEVLGSGTTKNYSVTIPGKDSMHHLTIEVGYQKVTPT